MRSSRKKGKGSPYSTAERRVPELIPVLGRQPAGDVSHKPDDRLPLLSARLRAALTGKHDTLVRRAPGWQGAPDGQQAKKIVVTKCSFYCKINILQRPNPCQPGALRIHLTRLSTEGLGPRHGEVRRAHQMLNAVLARPEVTPATLKRAATNFAAY